MKIVIIGGTGRAAIVARPALATELALVMAATIEADGKKLLEEAIAVAGLEPPQFAREILDVDARSGSAAGSADSDRKSGAASDRTRFS